MFVTVVATLFQNFFPKYTRRVLTKHTIKIVAVFIYILAAIRSYISNGTVVEMVQYEPGLWIWDYNDYHYSEDYTNLMVLLGNVDLCIKFSAVVIYSALALRIFYNWRKVKRLPLAIDNTQVQVS